MPTDQQTPLLPSSHQPSQPSETNRLRRFLRWFLTSKYGHYWVILLVTLDVAGIFADFIITLHICEHQHDEDVSGWRRLNKALGVLSLVISCLFVVELLASVFAFGFSYFKSKFHIFDASTIVASFLVDVLTHGPLEEAGSLIIVLRLFRVFKIVEESSDVAVDTLDGMTERIRDLEVENGELKRRLTARD